MPDRKGEPMDLAIYGSGGLGREVLDCAQVLNSISPRWERIIFVDDVNPNMTVNGITTATFDDIHTSNSPENCEFFIAIGEPGVRKALAKKTTECGYRLTTIIHPSAVVSENAHIEAGVFVGPLAYVSCNTHIEENVYLQPHVLIGHDAIVRAHSVISPMASLAGHCQVGEASYVGMGATVKEKTVIGSRVIVGMGSAVFRDLPDDVVAFGSPARITKPNEEHRVFK
jgi:sugar O-acyltransferase (sialic acid O-acetyltransferase NeuD family)